MAQYLFGAGKIFATPIQDVYGQPISNPTPVEVGVMQSVEPYRVCRRLFYLS
ncbi:hypothetical protein F962_01559 [Acinetobacter baumannii NIPH 190]|nr:hypothetical protein F962_01559 [Acinetobacter baumannii NIPH 190]